jgi:hypothetical protein
LSTFCTRARAELGFSRQLEQPQRVAPHPFLSGTGNPVWYREQQLEKWNAGKVTDVSESSLFHWSGRLEPGRVGPSNFSIVPRPPFHPKYGPIENKICEVMGKIRLKKEEDWDMNRLELAIMLAAYQIISFDTSFQHCGYRWNKTNYDLQSSRQLLR